MKAHLFRLLSRLKSDPIGAPALVLQFAFHCECVRGEIHGSQREDAVRNAVARRLVVNKPLGQVLEQLAVHPCVLVFLYRLLVGNGLLSLPVFTLEGHELFFGSGRGRYDQI
jgi:hypothetical protein